MGLFPTKVVSIDGGAKTAPPRRVAIAMLTRPRWLRFGPRVPSRRLSVFTRQLATLTEAGMPLLRGLRILEQQEESRAFKRVIGEISAAIEDGCSLAEAVSAHRRVFNH